MNYSSIIILTLLVIRPLFYSPPLCTVLAAASAVSAQKVRAATRAKSYFVQSIMDFLNLLRTLWSIMDYNSSRIIPHVHIPKAKCWNIIIGINDCVQMRHVLYIRCLYRHSAVRPVLRYYCTETKWSDCIIYPAE